MCNGRGHELSPLYLTEASYSRDELDKREHQYLFFFIGAD